MPERFVTSPLLAALPGLRHAFSTRQGGTSRGELASLNLSFGRDDPDRVRENRARLAVAADLHGPWVEVRQVHGARVVPAEEVEPDTEADAIVVTTPGTFAAVRTADCVPVLVAALDPASGNVAAVAAIHAGWRGAVAGVAAAAIAELARRGHPPDHLRVALGPAISIDHFEVGPEVIDAATRAQGGRPPPTRPGPRGRPHLDLVEMVRSQVEAAGVPTPHIDTLGACTYAEADRFFSHRRQQGQSGHHLSLVGFGA